MYTVVLVVIIKKSSDIHSSIKCIQIIYLERRVRKLMMLIVLSYPELIECSIRDEMIFISLRINCAIELHQYLIIKYFLKIV